MKTIQQLRKQGYKIRVNHWRRREFDDFDGNESRLQIKHDPSIIISTGSREKKIIEFRVYPQKYLRNNKWVVDPRGGLTELELTSPDGKIINVSATCRYDENFNRKLALRICLGRVAKFFSLDNF